MNRSGVCCSVTLGFLLNSVASSANPWSSCGLHVEDAQNIYVHQIYFVLLFFLVRESVQNLGAVHVQDLAVTCFSKPYYLPLTWPLTLSASLTTICQLCSQYLLDLQYIVLHERAKPQTTGSSVKFYQPWILIVYSRLMLGNVRNCIALIFFFVLFFFGWGWGALFHLHHFFLLGGNSPKTKEHT